MKRPLFIIIGAIIVLILLGVWVYIILFSNPNNTDDTYTTIDLGDTTSNSYEPIQNDEQPVVDIEGPERLRQLTTTPVVGYQEVKKNASSSPSVYYVAAGTGYIFALNLETGEEKRISATTIPSSFKAAITPNGLYVLVQSGSGIGADFVIGTLSSSTDQLETKAITEPIIDFSVTTNNTFLYAVKTNATVIAKEYDPVSDTAKTLFTVPFREAVIDWGSTADETHYVYPKATNQFEGYVYATKNGVLHRLPAAGYGISATGNSAGVLYSKQEKGSYNTYLYNEETGETNNIFLSTIPEKCSPLYTTTALICGSSSDVNSNQMPDLWYKGEATFSDNLWSFDLENAVFTQLVDISSETGRNIEVSKIVPNLDDTHIYFTNTATGNLWMFSNEQ